jgi:hypothetical protein
MFLLVFMRARLFQATKGDGSTLAETEEVTIQPVPKPVCMARTKSMPQFHCQRPMTGTNQILTQLNFVRRENADATPTARNGDIPLLGTIRSLESVVQGFEERAVRLESDIKDSQKRAGELEAKVGAPFEKEERYHKLVNRQSEIEDQLDLTKNQAPSQVDADESDANEQKISEKQTPTETTRHSRRASIRV